jgi:NAD(P)-dependent dehydrogenase (short-subunit alcohol dehydrogenase family)
MTKVWLVTGASRGIGEAVARRAAAAGDQVALVARGEAVEAVAAELGGIGIRADLGDPAALPGVVDLVVAQYGRIDVLVNNAGVHRGGKLDRVSLDDFQTVLTTNLVGPFELCRLAVPHMAPGSAIVNIGAVVGFRGFPGDSPYGAAKAGLAGLTLVLAVELARHPISVNLVVPGATDTDIFNDVDEVARERLIKRIPMRRMASADEIAAVVQWVAATPYMTGAVIPVDGGMMAGL